jgi:predicted ribonuclease toxin of YeeF-YezG toxin-antitoxin module
MLEIRKTAISLDEKEILELERIVVDSDEQEALRFLKKIVYGKLAQAQRHCEVFYARNQKDSHCL